MTCIELIQTLIIAFLLPEGQNIPRCVSIHFLTKSVFFCTNKTLCFLHQTYAGNNKLYVTFKEI